MTGDRVFFGSLSPINPHLPPWAGFKVVPLSQAFCDDEAVTAFRYKLPSMQTTDIHTIHTRFCRVFVLAGHYYSPTIFSVLDVGEISKTNLAIKLY